MKAKKVIAIVATLAVVGASVPGGIYAYNVYQKDRIVAEVVTVSDISSGYWGDTESSYGMLTNDSAQEIYLDDNKTVEEVYVKMGDEIQIGDALLKYDTREAEIEIRRKTLELDTIKNDISIAQHELNELRSKTPSKDSTATNTDYLESRIDAIEREMDSLLERPQNDPRDNRIHNYVTSGTVPFNASVAAGTEKDPYIIPCNKNAFVLGSFFQKLGSTWKGKYVQFVVVKKDQYGRMVTTEKTVADDGDPGIEKPDRPSGEDEISPSSGTAVTTIKGASTKKVTVPVADSSTSPNTVTYSESNRPSVSSADEMWYIFSGVQIGAELKKLQAELERLEGSDSDQKETYTAEELRQAILEKEDEIKKADLKRRQEELKLQSLQSAAANGVVYATVEGHVKSIADLSEADEEKRENRAFMVVTSDDGLYVKGTISELSLDSVQPGTVVTGNSWESGTTFSATVTEISPYPTANNSWGEGNPNVSYYEYTAYIADSSALTNGEYVDLTIGGESEDEEEENSDKIYIEKAYVRKEDGKSYCMIAGEDGRLKKQFVVTGKTIYGTMVEIKAGLLQTDRIAFPYGKTAVEGALVKDGSDDILE